MKLSDDQPLAEKSRPAKDKDLLGQDHIWAPKAPLYEMVARDKLFAVILWGPPGTGKTSLARLIGETTGRAVISLSAVSDGVPALRRSIETSQKQIKDSGKASLVFIDEVHRLSRNQQDVLLPAIETGQIRFIGATTENPSFEVNAAILSRSLVFRLERLQTESLLNILRRSLKSERPKLEAAPILEIVAWQANGDARKALTLLDALLATYEDAEILNLETLPDSLAEQGGRYDKNKEEHFDTISAMIKSIRASHPDAAIYYLAKMIAGGEDPNFIARRVVIAASEDIGNADPQALVLAEAAANAVHRIGMPEARIVLGQIVTYLAAAPKSNASYLAIDKAIDKVKDQPNLEIPLHLRNAPTKLMKGMGYGDGYIYPHDCQDGSYRKLSYLPQGLKSPKRFYLPKGNGEEKRLIDYLKVHMPAKDLDR